MIVITRLARIGERVYFELCIWLFKDKPYLQAIMNCLVLIGSIVALFLAVILFFVGILSSLAMAQLQQQQTTTTSPTSPPAPSSSLSITTTPPLTPQEQQQQNRLQNVIASTTANLNETEKQVSGMYLLQDGQNLFG